MIVHVLKNVASGMCLDAWESREGSPISVWDCNGGKNQQWNTTKDIGSTAGDGWLLKNERDLRCVDIPGGNTGNGVLLENYSCHGQWNQRWRIRTAEGDCTESNRFDDRASICVGAQMKAVMASWRQGAVSLQPWPQALPTTAWTFVSVKTKRDSTAWGAIDFGSRVENGTSNTPTYAAYWVDGDATGMDYHVIDPQLARGSDQPSGRLRSFLIEARDDTGPWDLYYDYNFVASSTSQGNYGSSMETGVKLRYIDHINLPQVSIRPLWRDANGLWFRPFLAGLATSDLRRCNTPVREGQWFDPTLNVVPNCFESQYTTRAASSDGTPATLESFTVSKPHNSIGAPQQLSIDNKSLSAEKGFSAPTRTLNGVDQNILEHCIAQGTQDCRSQVPGLADCMARRLLCSGDSTVAKKSVPATEITPAQAKDVAHRTIVRADSVDRTPTTVTSVKVSDLPTGIRGQVAQGLGVDSDVYLVSSDARVHSLGSRAEHLYTGYKAVVNPTTGQLVAARLGSAG